MEPRVTVVHELTLEFLADRWRERTKEVRRGGQKEEEGDACVSPILYADFAHRDMHVCECQCEIKS